MYFVPKKGGYYSSENIIPNTTYVFENIDTEKIIDISQSDKNYHLYMKVSGADQYTDDYALYPKIHIKNCPNLFLQPKSAIGHFIIENSVVNAVDATNAGDSKATFIFENTEIRPDVIDDGNEAFILNKARVTHINSIIFPYIGDGVVNWEKSKTRIGIFTINAEGTEFQLFGKHIGTELSQQLRDYMVAQCPGNPIFTYLEAMQNFDPKTRGNNYIPAKAVTTAQRPTKGLYTGHGYYDHDIKKEITWDNPTSTWRDAMSNIIS